MYFDVCKQLFRVPHACILSRKHFRVSAYTYIYVLRGDAAVGTHVRSSLYVLQDIKEIIENCAHKHWGDRKEGLVGLQHFLNTGNTLTTTELRRVTDIFTKMFMDSHTKVFSLFLDTLNELIVTHNEDLGDWLYVLCARLLNKLGTDLLGSIQSKIHKTLDVVR